LGAVARKVARKAAKAVVGEAACNPELAHRALSADTETGLLLPCNVTVEEVPEGGTLVRMADPVAMLQVGALRQNKQIRLVAEEAGIRLQRAAELLSRSPTAAAG